MAITDTCSRMRVARQDQSNELVGMRLLYRYEGRIERGQR
jgi:hypothetical protein